MQVVQFSANHATPIELFESVNASAVPVGQGSGEVKVSALHFAVGGCIGPHPTGYAQLFLVVQGSGWAAGADGHRVPLRAGEGAWFLRGELHSKGSDEGMLTIMVQASEMQPATSV
jgi:hypothetical protein